MAGRKKSSIVVDPSTNQVYINGNLLRAKQNYDAVEDYYTNIQEYFANGSTTGQSHLSNVMQKFFKNAEKNMDKSAYTNLQTMKMYEQLFQDTKNYIDSKKAQDVDFSKYMLREQLFDWQKKVYDSDSHNKTMLCGRRSGKSYVVIRLALKHCIEDPPIINNIRKERRALIVGLTIEKTASLYWDGIKEAIEKAHIQTAKIDNGSYTIYFPNGNTLQLAGNNSKQEREKYRGKDISFVCIDECQSQQGLYYFINDILSPMLRGTNGYLVGLGTAPLSANTPWEKMINDDSFEHFHATMEDNPSIPDYQHALQNVLESNHWTSDNITFRREYLGELAYDTNRLIYPVRKYYDKIPDSFKPRFCYIGADYGWRDKTAFMPIISNGQQSYLVDEFAESKVPASKIVEKMKTLTTKIHKDWNIPVEDIYIIQDTSHQMIGQDFYNEGVSNIKNAYKLEQNSQIARVSEALELGELLIKENGPFDKECNEFIWQWNAEKGCVVYKIDDDAFHGDAVDAVQYAYSTMIADFNAS